MTATYDSRQRRVGATMVEIQPNLVAQVKTADGKDGYNAVQLGYGTKKSVKKPQLGHVKKTGLDKAIRWFREIRQQATGGSEQSADLKPGQEINLSQVFSIGDAVKVSGISKGKGFQGGVRRHGFHGGPKTHGQSDRERAPGSIGQTTTPGRVYKGKRMSGRSGGKTVTVKGLKVIEINLEKKLLIVEGLVPGSKGKILKITKIVSSPSLTN